MLHKHSLFFVIGVQHWVDFHVLKMFVEFHLECISYSHCLKSEVEVEQNLLFVLYLVDFFFFFYLLLSLSTQKLLQEFV